MFTLSHEHCSTCDNNIISVVCNDLLMTLVRSAFIQRCRFYSDNVLLSTNILSLLLINNSNTKHITTLTSSCTEYMYVYIYAFSVSCLQNNVCGLTVSAWNLNDPCPFIDHYQVPLLLLCHSSDITVHETFKKFLLVTISDHLY